MSLAVAGDHCGNISGVGSRYSRVDCFAPFSPLNWLRSAHHHLSLEESVAIKVIDIMRGSDRNISDVLNDYLVSQTSTALQCELHAINDRLTYAYAHGYEYLRATAPVSDVAFRTGWPQIQEIVRRDTNTAANVTSVRDVYNWFESKPTLLQEQVLGLELCDILGWSGSLALLQGTLLHSKAFGTSLLTVRAVPDQREVCGNRIQLNVFGGAEPESRLMLNLMLHDYLTYDRSTSIFRASLREAINAPGEDLMIPVFENGKLLVDHSFADIRARAGF